MVKYLMSSLIGLALFVNNASATFTGLLLTSGANLYETASSGTLTLVTTYVNVSLGALAQGSQTSSTSSIWLLNSAGTDLYHISLSAPNVVGQSHIGSLGVTGVGLAYVGSTLYTLVYNSTNSNYDLYTVSQSNGSATKVASGLAGGGGYQVGGFTTDGTYLYPAVAALGKVYKYNTSGTFQNSNYYDYSVNSPVYIDSLAWDGSQMWLLDNSTKELSNGAFSGFGTTQTVTVDATYNASYNGMCWGYVPW